MAKGIKMRYPKFWDTYENPASAEGLGLDNIDFDSLNWQDAKWQDFFSPEEKELFESGVRKKSIHFDNMKQVRANDKKEKKWLKAYRKANPDAQSVMDKKIFSESKWKQLTKASRRAYYKAKKTDPTREGKGIKSFVAEDKDGFKYWKYGTQAEYDNTAAGKREIAEKAAQLKKHGAWSDTKGDRAAGNKWKAGVWADNKARQKARNKVSDRKANLRRIAQMSAAAYRPWNQKSWMQDGTFNQEDADKYMYYKDLNMKMGGITSWKNGMIWNDPSLSAKAPVQVKTPQSFKTTTTFGKSLASAQKTGVIDTKKSAPMRSHVQNIQDRRRTTAQDRMRNRIRT